MKHKVILLTLFFVIPFMASGQLSGATDSLLLDEVVISATRQPTLLERTPEVIRVISSRDIKALNVQTTGEILEYVTGINVESGTGSGLPKRSIISMNGFPANYSLILLNGAHLLTEHIHTGQNVDLIPPHHIERIEIIKGAASAQYGSDAMGGVINIITKKGGPKPELSISSSYGSYATSSVGIMFSAPIKKKLRTSNSFNWERSDGYPILAPKHRIGKMGYAQYTFMSTLDYALTMRSTLSGFLCFIHSNMQWKEDEDKYSRMVSPHVQIQTELSDHLRLISRLNYSTWMAEQSDEANELFRPEMFLSYSRVRNNRLSFGGDFRRMNFKRSNVLEKGQNTWGLFAQDEINYNKWSIFLAVRFDKVETLTGVISPKFAFLYEPAPFLRIRGSMGKGFHAPTVQELYEKGAGHGGRAYRFGNPELKPEYSLTTTLGSELFISDVFQVTLGGYYNTVDNLITPVYRGPWEENPEIDKWERQNIHQAKIFGYELSARWNLLKNLEFEGGYSNVDNENTTTGRPLPYYPGRSFYSKCLYRYHVSESFSGSVFFSLRGTRDRRAWNWKPQSGAEPDNQEGLTTNLKDYELIGAGTEFRYKVMTGHIKLSNLLGQNIEQLDDIYTIIKGEPVISLGLKIQII